MEERGDYSWPVSLLNRGTPACASWLFTAIRCSIRVYDEADNEVEMHKHIGDFKEP
jgi:hypothetical protein